MKNFSDFYINIGGNKGQIQSQGIKVQLPNFSLSDSVDKKINDIFYTVKNTINYIENNFANSNGMNHGKKSFDDYMNEINDLKNKIKKLSMLFNKNDNLLNALTNENQLLRQRNAALENAFNSMYKSKQMNNNKSEDQNKNNFWKMKGVFNSNLSNINYNNTSPEIDNKEKNPSLELKDLISSQQKKNGNLIHDFQDKNQKIISLEKEANKLINENYVGDKNKIFNQNSKNVNTFNNNNQIFTFKNENPEEQNEEEKEEQNEEEEIVDDLYNNIENNKQDEFNDENMEENEIYDEYDENNISNEEEIYANEDEQFNDINNNY